MSCTYLSIPQLVTKCANCYKITFIDLPTIPIDRGSPSFFGRHCNFANDFWPESNLILILSWLGSDFRHQRIKDADRKAKHFAQYLALHRKKNNRNYFFSQVVTRIELPRIAISPYSAIRTLVSHKKSGENKSSAIQKTLRFLECRLPPKGDDDMSSPSPTSTTTTSSSGRVDLNVNLIF